MKILNILFALFVMGCSKQIDIKTDIYHDPKQEVIDYSKQHPSVTCKLVPHPESEYLLGDYNCKGGEIVNGTQQETKCDWDYQCSDGKIITERY